MGKINDDLSSLCMGKVLCQELLCRHTTMKVGGPADFFLFAETTEDLRNAMLLADEQDLPCFILGNGSNLLVRDAGIRGLVVKLAGDFKKMEFSGAEVTVGAGVMLPVLAIQAVKRGLKGLELLAGIPGTIGGAVVMNAGALGQSIGDVVQQVTVLDRKGVIHVLQKEDLQFGYRKSILQTEAYVVLEVVFALENGEKAVLQETLQGAVQKRKRSQPLAYPNAGSVFRNPKQAAAGKLIEEVGLKGMRIGDAVVSPQHGNFIVNMGNARAEDVLQLMKEIQSRVYEKFRISLEPEIKIIGG